MRLWDVRTGRVVHTLRGHPDAVVCLAFAPDGQQLVTGDQMGNILVWDRRNVAAPRPLPKQPTTVCGLCYAPDGAHVIVATDHVVRVLHHQTGQVALECRDPLHRFTCIDSAPDGRTMATGAVGGMVKVWDRHTGAVVRELKQTTLTIIAVRFAPDGRTLASANQDRTIHFWDLATSRLIHIARGHTESVGCIAFAPSGQQIVSGSFDGTAKLWDVRYAAPVLELEGAHSTIDSVGLTPDGTHLLTTNSSILRVWDSRTGRLLTLRGYPRGISGLAMAPDGLHFVAAYNDNTARIGRLDQPGWIQTLSGHMKQVTCTCYSPDGRQIATGSADGTVRLWDVATGQQRALFNVAEDLVRSVAISPDGRWLASSAQRTVAVWDIQTHAKQWSEERHRMPIAVVAFAPDSTCLLTASTDRQAKICAVTTGEVLRELNGHEEGIRAACFMPGGQRVVTGAGDGVLILWDVPTGTPLLKINAHAESVTALTCSSDGTQIVSAGADRVAKRWSVNLRDTVHSPREAVDECWEQTNPNPWRHQAALDDAKQQQNAFAQRFHIDRLLAIPTQRTDERWRERLALTNDPRVAARTSYHTLSVVTTWDQGIVQAMAVNGDVLAKRLLAQDSLKRGQPHIALPRLFECLITRPATWPGLPPVEELLIAEAYHALKQPDEALKWLGVAQRWLAEPHAALRWANVVMQNATNPWEALSATVRPIDDPRYNSMMWEAWFEYAVLLEQVRQLLNR